MLPNKEDAQREYQEATGLNPAVRCSCGRLPHLTSIHNPERGWYCLPDGVLAEGDTRARDARTTLQAVINAEAA